MPRTKKCTTQPVKLSRLCYLDRRTKVATPAWQRAHPKWQQRKLSALRAMHTQHPHAKIKDWMVRNGHTTATAMPLRKMVRAVVKGNLKQG